MWTAARLTEWDACDRAGAVDKRAGGPPDRCCDLGLYLCGAAGAIGRAECR